MKFMNIELAGARPAAGWLGLVLACVGMIAAAWVMSLYDEEARELAAWEDKLQSVKRMARRTPSVPVEPPREARAVQQEAKVALAVLQQMSVPWDKLFRDIEQSASDAVALVSIQPDALNQVVRISGEARNLDAMLDYTRRLGQARSLSNIVVTSHEVKAQDAHRPVNFSLIAAWSNIR